MISIKKRNGTIVAFDESKIENAIRKAFLDEEFMQDGEHLYKATADVNALEIKEKVMVRISKGYQEDETITVEEIQDIVEDVLMKSRFKDVAKSYIRFRHKKELSRKKFSENQNRMIKTIEEITFEDSEENDGKRENANINGNSAMGTMLQYGSTVSKEFAVTHLLKEEHSEAHRNGDIHIHDLDFYAMGTTTCTQIDLEKIFKKGFSTGHGFLREPQSIGSYASLAAIVIQANQNDQHGGQSINAFDFYLAPGVLKTFKKNLCEVLETLITFEAVVDLESVEFKRILTYVKKYLMSIDKDRKVLETLILLIHSLGVSERCAAKIVNRAYHKALQKTEKETNQAMEALVHNLNTMNSRAGSQVPFSSINFGTDTTSEGRMVSNALLLAVEAGLGHGETAIFPITIFKVKEGVNYNPEDKNYDLFKLAMRVSAKRMFPNFSFLDAPFNLTFYKEGDYHSEAAYMGCVDGVEIITYKYESEVYSESFRRAWYRLEKSHNIRYAGLSEYMDLKSVRIFDSYNERFVPCERMIRNPDKGDWRFLRFSNGKTLFATADHPLPIKDRGRVLVQDIQVGDKVFVAKNLNPSRATDNEQEIIEPVLTVEQIGFLGRRDRSSYDVTTSTDRFDVSGIQSHNCRTRVLSNEAGPSQSTSRGNLSFTSINLPRLGIKYGLRETPDIDGFYQELSEKVELVKEQLLERLKYQGQRKVKNSPFLMGQGVWLDSDALTPEDTLQDVLRHGTLTVGFIGLAECLTALIGKHHGESGDAQCLGLEIVGRIREQLDEYNKELKLNFSLIATPAEGLSGRFLKLDKERYGEIKGVTDKEYYTNSFHIPVSFPILAHKKISLEAPYHRLTNAGHISYIEFDGSPLSNLEAFEKIIRTMKESGMGYGSINHPIDRDPVCGFTGIIGDTCPKCGREEGDVKFERIRRVTGYLVGTLDRFNDSKKAEERDRVKHLKGEFV